MERRESHLSIEKYLSAYSVVGKRTQFLERLQFYRFIAHRFLGPASRVVDVGCGEGFGVYVMSRTAREAVGVDTYREAIDRAQRVYEGAGRHYATALPDGERFDVVCALDVIEHVDDDVAFLRGLLRMAAPGARVVVSTPNKLLSILTAGRIYEFHRREYCYSEFVATLRRACDAPFEVYGVNPGGLSRVTLRDRLAAGLTRRLPHRIKDFLRSVRFKSAAPRAESAWRDYVDALWETDYPITIRNVEECLPYEDVSDYIAVIRAS